MGRTEKVARALRRHPPSTCQFCGKDITWYIVSTLGWYIDDEGTGYCATSSVKHHVPIGKEPRPSSAYR